MEFWDQLHVMPENSGNRNERRATIKGAPRVRYSMEKDISALAL